MTVTEQERERDVGEAQRSLLDRLDELAEKNRRAYRLALDDFRRAFTLGPTTHGIRGG